MDPTGIATPRADQEQHPARAALVDARFVTKHARRDQATEPRDHRGSAMMITFAWTVGA